MRIAEVAVETNGTSLGVDIWKSRDWDLPWVLDGFEEKIIFLTDDNAGPVLQGQQLRAIVKTHKKKFTSELLTVRDLGAGHEYFTVTGDSFRKLTSRLPNRAKQLFTMNIKDFGTEDN